MARQYGLHDELVLIDQSQLRQRQRELHASGEQALTRLLLQPPHGLAELAGVHDLQIDGNETRFSVDTARLESALAALTGLGVRSLVSRPPTLEELFLRLVGNGGCQS